ncbi:hypothetical protein GIB67_013065 [Kingdonia uniflora]|uniref:KIB1-4 beta-propeller domain-containing protein n=1 Tax=Kingdonia uniflora TaxID=39325 RepID=A0A7J7MD05_9MAGN|nr:hypothetical protein GIB67_013065 [Kingdonia uniflora]
MSQTNLMDVPDHLLSIILDKIRSFDDLTRFGIVSVRLQTLFAQNQRDLSVPGLPLLVVRTQEESDKCSAYDISEEKVFDLNLSIPLGNYCRGSSHGWLVMQEDADYINNLGKYMHVDKVVVSVDPSRFTDFSLMGICFCKSIELAYFKAGDKDWSFIKPSLFTMTPVDVMYYQGLFYVINYDGKVSSIDIRSRLPKETLVGAHPPIRNLHEVELDKKLYLVELSGELLQVVQMINLDDDSTVRFHVFKLDPMVKIWIEVKTLWSHMILVASNSSFCVAVTDFPGCKPNCIYYASNDQQSAQNILVYDLENESFVLHQNTQLKTFMSPFIWIQPSPRQRISSKSKAHNKPWGKAPIGTGRDNYQLTEYWNWEKDWGVSMKANLRSQKDELKMEMEQKSAHALRLFLSMIDLHRDWSLSDAEDVQQILKNCPRLPDTIKSSLNSVKEAVDQGVDHLKLAESGKLQLLEIVVEDSNLVNDRKAAQRKVAEEMWAATLCFQKAKDIITSLCCS